MKELTVLTNNNERVLTTKQLAEVYETAENNIKNNFRNNKIRFIEGKHYYLLKGDLLRDFKREVNDIDLVANNVNQLYLWTEKGASRMCKILDTDRAWDQFDVLEDTYFKIKDNMLKASYTIEDPIERAKAWIKEQEEKLKLTAKIEEDKPFVEIAKERIVKGDKMSITDLTKGLKLKRGQITKWLKQKGYIYNGKRIEVNNFGSDYVKIYKEGNFNCYGFTEKGIKLVNDNIEEISYM